jgi:photosystem II stability/assembly factor-like uncharacterized protein
MKLIHPIIFVFSLILPALIFADRDCLAELIVDEATVVSGPLQPSPAPRKLPTAKADPEQKAKKAHAKWERIQAGMFPKELGEMLFRQKATPDGSFDPKAYLKAKESITLLEKSVKNVRKSPDSVWSSLGPEFVGGRINDLQFHRQNQDIMWIATPGSGILKTVDRGKTWKASEDFPAVLSVFSLAMSSKDPLKMYAGTGDFPSGMTSGAGAGLLTSHDGGETWAAGRPELGSEAIFSVATTSARTGLVLVGNAKGIIRSTDDGASWESCLQTAAPVNAVAISSKNPDVIYAGHGWGFPTEGKLMVSRSAGAKNSWLEVRFPDLKGKAGRIEIAVGAADGVAYASIGSADTQGALALYRSSDEGATWEKVYDRTTGPVDYLGYYDERGKAPYFDGQQWYAHCLAVDPKNSNIVIFGGIDLYRSEDGGKTIKKVSRWDDESDSRNLSFVHADIHKIRFSPYEPSVVYACTDGALFVSRDNGNTWEALRAPLPITQLYHFAMHPNREEIVAGAQDNGTVMLRNGEDRDWWAAGGGDGAFCGWDQQFPSLKYGSLPYLEIFRRQWFHFFWVGAGIPKQKQEPRLFIAPFIIDPKDGNHALAGTTRLYRHTGFRKIDPNSNPWKAVSGELTAYPPQQFRGAISWIALDPSNSKVVWVGSSDGAVSVCRDMDATTPVFQRVGENQLPKRFWVRGITVSPADPNCVFVISSTQGVEHIWKTTDGGKTWTPATKDVPKNLPVNTLIFDPRDPKKVYIGTDIGVLTSGNLGDTWEPMNKGLNYAPVSHFIMRGDTLYASTFGRGVYKTQVGNNPTTKAADKTPIRLLVNAADNPAMMEVAKRVDGLIGQNPLFKTVMSFNDIADVTVAFGSKEDKNKILIMDGANQVYAGYELSKAASPERLAEQINQSLKTVGLLKRVDNLGKSGSLSLQVTYAPDKTGLPEFAMNEPFQVRVRPSRDAYVYTYSLSDSGALEMLLPDDVSKPRLVKRDEWFIMNLKATGTPGTERLYFVASDQPLRSPISKGSVTGPGTWETLAGDLGVLPMTKGATATSAEYATGLLVMDTVDPKVFSIKEQSVSPTEAIWKMLREKSKEELRRNR